MGDIVSVKDASIYLSFIVGFFTVLQVFVVILQWKNQHSSNKNQKNNTYNTFLYTIHAEYQKVLCVESNVRAEISDLIKILKNDPSKGAFIDEYFKKSNLLCFTLFFEHFGGLVKHRSLSFSYFYDIVIFPDLVWKEMSPIIAYVRRFKYINNYLENMEYLFLLYQYQRLKELKKYGNQIDRNIIEEYYESYNRLPVLGKKLKYSDEDNQKKMIQRITNSYYQLTKISNFRYRINNGKFSLKTRRLIIRDIMYDDKLAFCSIVGNTDFYFYYFNNKTVDDFIYQAIHESIEVPRATYKFALVLKKNQKTIGYVSLCQLDGSLHEPDIGYFINPEYQNLGYAKEAVTAIIKWATKDLDINEIYATVEPSNEPSKKVLFSSNFVQIGEIEKYTDGKPRLVLARKNNLNQRKTT